MSATKDLASALLEAPRNRWLALNEEETEVVGQGETPEAALTEAQARGVTDPLLIWAPESWLARVF